MFVFPAAAAGLAALIAFRAVVSARRSGSVALWLWAFAFAQFSVASAALALGVGTGWSESVYRVYYLFGAILNVVWLGLGTVWLLAPRRDAIVVTVLVVAASLYAAVACLGADLLPGAASALADQTVPSGRVVMPAAVRSLSRWFSIGGTLVVLGGLLYSIARGTPRSRGLGLLAAGVAVVAVASELVRLGAVAPFSLGLAVGVALMYLGFRSTQRTPSRGHPPAVA